MKQVNAVPDRAATFVVHPTPGIGDATTIQEALDMLPAEGGSLFVREGTYAQSVTITIPAGKPVSIFGSGNNTILSLGANAIPAFTVPTGAVTNTPIYLHNFKVTGTEVADQAVLEYADANSLAEIYIEHVDTAGIEKTINVTNASQASSSPGEDDARFHLAYCRIRPNSTDTSVILSNPSVGYPRCWMEEVEFIGDSLFAIPMGRTEPLFGRFASDDWFGDVYMTNCEMSVGFGEHDVAAFGVTDSIIYNNDSSIPLIDILTFGSFADLNPGSIRGSTFRGIRVEGVEGMSFLTTQFTDCVLDLFGVDSIVGDGCTFLQDTVPYPAAFVIRIQNEDMKVIGSSFDISTAPAAIININAPSFIIGNDFEGVNSPGVNGCVHLNNGTCIIVGNKFPFAPTSGPPLRESNGPNYYHANSRLFNNGGLVVQPVIPQGQGSEVEGMLDQNGTGSIGGGTAIVIRYKNPFGLAQVKGYIQNSGVNNWTLTETYITQTLGTFTRVTTPFTPGSTKILDPFDFTGLALTLPQVVEYRVSVTVIAGAAGFTRFFGAPCGVSGSL